MFVAVFVFSMITQHQISENMHLHKFQREQDQKEVEMYQQEPGYIRPELLKEQGRVISKEQRDKISNFPLPNPLPDLPDLLPSVDFREYKMVGRIQNQGENCHTCWSHAATSLLETIYLTDREKIKKLSPYFYKDTADHIIQISTAFLMTNQNVGGYCGGGNALGSIVSIIKEFGSFESEENYPKNYGLWQSVFYRKERLPFIINESQQYFPIKIFLDNGSYKVRIPLYFDSNKSFPNKTIYTIKSYLNRGIPILVSANSWGPDHIKYLMYDGERILKQRCVDSSAYHQVVIIGYGKKYGKDVWIVKNSWGLGWGAYGCYFVEIGSDANCIEHDAEVLIPAQYIENERLPKIDHVRGGRQGKFQLDRDPGDPIVNDRNNTWYNTQHIPVVREQTYEMVSFIVICTFPFTTCFLAFMAQSIINIIKLNKLHKNIVRYNMQHRRLKEFITQKDSKNSIVDDQIQKPEILS